MHYRRYKKDGDGYLELHSMALATFDTLFCPWDLRSSSWICISPCNILDWYVESMRGSGRQSTKQRDWGTLMTESVY